MSTTGKVIQVIGPVVDVEFPQGKLPNIYSALRIDQDEDKKAGTPQIRLTLEVAQHLGENRVRGVAMSSTDGLVRGMPVRVRALMLPTVFTREHVASLRSVVDGVIVGSAFVRHLENLDMRSPEAGVRAIGEHAQTLIEALHGGAD